MALNPVCLSRKIIRFHAFLLHAMLLMGFCSQSNAQESSRKINKSALPSELKSLQNLFVHIPDSVQTSVYWYWISGNISKEGVVKDLEAMKKVGINRAFIGNIGLDDVPYGKVKMFSEEWWDILHTALKTATRLNIEIGLFNSPGWSQSGGPWIKPEMSMRYLASSREMVRGPIAFDNTLVKPQADFQDVKVLAYPVADNYNTDTILQRSKIAAVPTLDSINNLWDNNLATSVHLIKGQSYTLDINTATPFTLRSVAITIIHQPVSLSGDIQVKKGNEYVTIKSFTIDRTNPELNTGFTPWGTAAISLTSTNADKFRIVLSASANCSIAELKLLSTPMVENYIEKSLAKMWPTPHPFWKDYQWAPQAPVDAAYVVDPAKVLDLSAQMSADGKLQWKVPAGNWVIERIGMAPTKVSNAPAPPEGRGLEVDKMSTKHIAEHFDAYLGEIIKRIPAEDRKSWKVVVEDSYETGSQNWTDDLATEFKQKYHYDPTPYLPVLQGTVVGSQDISDRFLWDLRRLVADDVSFKYVGGLRQISHQHGLTTWLENYGHWGYPGEFLQYGGQSDEIGGEFWSEGDLGDIENRAASSSAHIYGKTKVSAESFTAAGNPWSRYPAMFKKRGDRFFTEGINNSLLHVYIQQPDDNALPGLSAWFGVEFNRLNTWFFDMDVLLKYLKRCNMMLQQGKYVADVAYFIGEDAPKMTGVTDPPLPQGYSFDYINADIIKDSLTVKDNKLCLPNGISYSLLVLPQLKTIRPELLVKIKELVAQGAVILGPKAERSPSLQGYPQADSIVRKLADEIWGNIDDQSVKTHQFGKGLVLSGMTMQQSLDMIKVIPDMKVNNATDVLFIHRQLGENDVYFISNQHDTPVNFSADFRIAGKKPQLWDAATGAVRNLPNYQSSETATSMSMQLAPYESAFVVFNSDNIKGDTNRSNYPNPIKVASITQSWIVRFDKDRRGPVNPVKFDTLTDWSKNVNDSIRYYSGTAYYHNTIDIKKIDRTVNYVLDLGIVKAIAKVVVNGIDVGGAWTPPYQVDITKALHTGKNNLEIKVVNTWVNRLLGDALLPANQRKTNTLFGPDPKNGLQSSGLIGPVSIKQYQY